ncbi:hypothetical protein [Fulvivirga lutimaris]|uniref:hypothetical protein n=1 Tax=Fulvivirga lutimaris TaxID=1819566 RepID=UPI001FE7C61C|nr:hypothetical protein [Fulvivirga lutimaris]
MIKLTSINETGVLDFAITADLLLTVPLVYFLLIRKTAIPNTTTIPVMIIGLLIGSYLMPAESQTYLSLFKNWALPIIELSILVFVIIKVRATIKKFRVIKGNSDDFYSALKHTCSEILPAPVATLMASEIAVLYYGFFNWGKKVYKENEFTYHKNSGAQGLFGGFILVIGIETFVLHNLAANWSIIAAWILSGLSIYTALQLLGFARSLAARPITIGENSVNLKYGIMNEVSIPFDEIESIEISSRELDKGKLEKKLSLLGELESHNVIIQLKNEHQLAGLYGMKSEFKVLGFYIDTALEFKAKLDDLIQIGDNKKA